MMNHGNTQFAILGARPRFEQTIPVGQLYFPSWDRYEVAMRGIFERQYYNNNGPLLCELEDRLQKFLNVKHAICVMNATFGLMMAVDAMKLSGKVIIPSFTFIASAQSLSWANVEPVFCDIDPVTHQIDLNKLDALIDDDVTAILGVNLWGGACDPSGLEKFAFRNGIKVYFDSAHAFGCSVSGTKVANFGSLEVFSFHATKILNATEGGCICTNDDELADRLRCIRPSYGTFKSVPIKRVANARMSEAQAAIALMSLDDFPKNQKRNESIFNAYEARLKNVPGIKLVRPSGVSFSNFQYLVCEVDPDVFGVSRDYLIELLKAENVLARRYFYPGIHRTVEYKDIYPKFAGKLPVTEKLCNTCIQLPIGAMVDLPTVDGICEILERIQANSEWLGKQTQGAIDV